MKVYWVDPEKLERSDLERLVLGIYMADHPMSQAEIGDAMGYFECYSDAEIMECIEMVSGNLDERQIEEARRYFYGEPDPGMDLDDEEYSPSAEAGDYGPGNPWDAPGMNVRDFI